MAETRPATKSDVPNLIEMVEQYWAVERLPGFDPASLARQLERLCTQAHLGSAWITHADGVAAG